MRTLFTALTAAALLGACVTPQAAPAAATAAATEAHAGMQPPLADATGATRAFDTKPKPGDKAICAVSGEALTVTAETKTAQHGGKYYAFCCDECAPEFAANPAKFAN
jgi:YHS domain-containing protein